VNIPTYNEAAHVCVWGLRHALLQCECLLLTQSGHWSDGAQENAPCQRSGMLVRLPFSVTTTACERIRNSPRIRGSQTARTLNSHSDSSDRSMTRRSSRADRRVDVLSD
jgi:hypothetical protein